MIKYTVTEYETKSGSKGLIVSVPDAPVVSTSFCFRAGYRYALDYEHKSQVAHVLEHIMAGMTSKYPSPKEFDAVFTKNGAYSNAFTSPRDLRYVSSCADFEWDRIMDLMIEEICHPYFSEKYFQSELGNVRSELTGYLSQPGRMLGSTVAKQMGFIIKTYPEYLESLDNITLDDVNAHWRHTHTAKNMRYVIAGDFEDKAKLQQLKDKLNSFDLPTGERFGDLADGDFHSAPAVVIEREDTPGINFNFFMEVKREYNDADDNAIDALNHILNGTMSSRIYGQAREQGLLYGCSSGCSSGKYSAEWYFGGRANNDKLLTVFDLIVKELQRVKDGDISESELDDAKSYALGKFQMGLQTAGQLANFLSGRYFYDGTIKKYEDGPAQIKAVTVDQMVKLANEYFDANIWSMGLWGTTDQTMGNKLQEKLSQLF